MVCHGDLHPGNILVDGNRLTGVLDYTVVTVAEPALDVGFTTMSFDVTPIDGRAASSSTRRGRSGTGSSRR